MLKSLLLKWLSSLKLGALPAMQTRIIWGGQGKIRTPDRESRGLEKETETAAALILFTADQRRKKKYIDIYRYIIVIIRNIYI